MDCFFCEHFCCEHFKCSHKLCSQLLNSSAYRAHPLYTANRLLSKIEAFYKAFDGKEGDKMYKVGEAA